MGLRTLMFKKCLTLSEDEKYDNSHIPRGLVLKTIREGAGERSR